MKHKFAVFAAVLAVASVFCWAAESRESTHMIDPIVQGSEKTNAMRVEGETRFRTNCGRCHAAPQKFPPRMMATIVRHMRVRATITDDDMRLVLFYLTQ
jgi:mono/diheme cytochrome c family protein